MAIEIPDASTAMADLEVGCVLLFSGLSELEDRLRKTLRSFWTRSALIVPGPHDVPAVLQATSRPIAPDLIDRDIREGVQIVSVRDVITTFAGSLGLRVIRPSISGQPRESLARFAVAVHGLPFNKSPYYSLRAAHRRNRESDGAKYFCTELVAAALQEIGVLARPPLGRSASNYVPGDFAEESQSVCLTSNYGLLNQRVFSCPLAITPP